MDASQLRFVKRKILNEVSLILDRELEAIASGTAEDAQRQDDVEQATFDVLYADVKDLYADAWKRG